jgi:hypothetical protein
MLLILAGMLISFLWSAALLILFMYGVLLHDNRQEGFKGSFTKSTREILWALRLRKTMD